MDPILQVVYLVAALLLVSAPLVVARRLQLSLLSGRADGGKRRPRWRERPLLTLMTLLGGHLLAFLGAAQLLTLAERDQGGDSIFVVAFGVALIVLYMVGVWRIFCFLALSGQKASAGGPDLSRARREARSHLLFALMLVGAAFAMGSVLRSIPVTAGVSMSLGVLLAGIGAPAILWWRLPRALARSHTTERLPEGERLKAIRRLCREARVPALDVLSVDVATPHAYNAWIAGPLASRRTLVLTRRLVDEFPRDELLAVVAHEFGHARLWHLPLYFSLAILNAVLSWLGGVLLAPDSPVLQGLYGLGLFLVVGPVCVCFAIRRCELAADRWAVDLTGEPQALVRALRKMHGANDTTDRRTGLLSGRWWRTHPFLERRLEVISASNQPV